MLKLDIITGTRAEYGLLKPVIQKLQESSIIELRLVVTGAHLSIKQGYTVEEIEKDGFEIDARLDFMATPVPDGRTGTAWRTLLAMDLFLGHFSPENLRPDAVLLLGDRYEIMAAAQAAALLDIPVIHISGGDVTEGANDDWFRHCITKMSKLHFPSCEIYRKRLIFMGENPDFVFNVGGLGDENIRKAAFLTKEELAESLNLNLDNPFAVVTFHPETATGQTPEYQIKQLLQAVSENTNLFYIFTKANADAGGETMNESVEEFCKQHDNAVLFSSLGVLRYLSAAKHAALVLGNSSSGVVEMPSLGVPTVDIGKRQAGRIAGENVLHAKMTSQDISDKIKYAQTAEFVKKAKQSVSPYNGGETSEKIVKTIEDSLKSGKLKPAKVFYDMA